MGSSELRPDGIMVTRSVYDSDGNLVDREHFSWTNTDMSKYQDKDFGATSIPNAMDESLDRAGMTREETAALEVAEQEPAMSGKQTATVGQSQTGAASVENISLVRRLLYFTRGICSWNFRLNYYTEKQ